MTKADVAAAVQRGVDARAAATAVSRDRVVAELAKIAFANVQDYFEVQDGRTVLNMEALRRGMEAGLVSVTVTERIVGEGEAACQVRRIRIRLTNKLVALRMLGEHLGAFRRPAGGRTPRIAAGLAAARQRVQADKAAA